MDTKHFVESESLNKFLSDDFIKSTKFKEQSNVHGMVD